MIAICKTDRGHFPGDISDSESNLKRAISVQKESSEPKTAPFP